MADVKNLVFTPDAVRELDRIAIEEVGIAGYTLMTRAGHETGSPNARLKAFLKIDREQDVS